MTHREQVSEAIKPYIVDRWQLTQCLDAIQPVLDALEADTHKSAACDCRRCRTTTQAGLGMLLTTSDGDLAAAMQAGWHQWSDLIAKELYAQREEVHKANVGYARLAAKMVMEVGALAEERDDLRARLDLLTPNHGAIWPWKCQSCGSTGRIVRQPDDTDAKAFWRRSVSHGVTRRTCKTANLMWVSKGAL